LFKTINKDSKIKTEGVNNGNPYGKAPPINSNADINAPKMINFFSLIIINMALI
jgi:hypothetical protein